MLVDRLADKLGKTINREECKSLVEKVRISDSLCLLVKPQTFMNLSGQAVSCLVSKHYVDPSQSLLVIVDDVALPIGKLRIRAKGSAGGHNGLKSIISQIGTQDFPRLRLGIKPETEVTDLADFVLDRFDSSERLLVESMLDRAEAAITKWLEEGIDKAIAFANNN